MSNQIGTTPIPSELGTTITGAINNLYIGQPSADWTTICNVSARESTTWYPCNLDDYTCIRIITIFNAATILDIKEIETSVFKSLGQNNMVHTYVLDKVDSSWFIDMETTFDLVQHAVKCFNRGSTGGNIATIVMAR